MKIIDWKEAKKKKEAYEYLMKVFNKSKPAVSLAMRFKRNSDDAKRMRYVAVHELGGKELNDGEVESKPVKILDSKGNVKEVVTL